MAMRELHWLMNLLTEMDVGIAVFDLQGRVHLWNSFMENHSGIASSEIMERDSLFDVFPVFREAWMQRKLESALLLDHGAFISWEQLPHLFRFNAYRPVTGDGGSMFQNITIKALKDASGKANLLALTVFDVTNIARNKLALQYANEELLNLSRIDQLTGLNNRRFWEEQLDHAYTLYKRYRTPCSLIIFDIDHFKNINDGYGHPAGDSVIQAIAETTRKSIRDCDIAGRYGGEEFALLLPEINAQGAHNLAERLRTNAEQLKVTYRGQTIRCTVSLGVAEVNTHFSDCQDWVRAADKALYLAKNSGRNNVQLAG